MEVLSASEIMSVPSIMAYVYRLRLFAAFICQMLTVDIHEIWISPVSSNITLAWKRLSDFVNYISAKTDIWTAEHVNRWHILRTFIYLRNSSLLAGVETVDSTAYQKRNASSSEHASTFFLQHHNDVRKLV